VTAAVTPTTCKFSSACSVKLSLQLESNRVNPDAPRRKGTTSQHLMQKFFRAVKEG
jgi:hypothetical protein